MGMRRKRDEVEVEFFFCRSLLKIEGKKLRLTFLLRSRLAQLRQRSVLERQVVGQLVRLLR